MADENEYRWFRSVSKTDLLFEGSDGTLTPYFDHINENPLISDPALRTMLRDAAAGSIGPRLVLDSDSIYYTVMQSGSGWMYLGPMKSGKVEEYRLQQYYRRHGLKLDEIRPLRTLNLPTIKDISLLAASMILGITYTEAELTGNATVDHEYDKREQVRTVLIEEEENDDGAWRHTYSEETALLLAVREGRTEDAIRKMTDMDDDEGRLSSSEIEHWRTLAVIGITLCSRAAIEGGMTPQSAYRISGYYINKCQVQKDVASVIRTRNRAIEELSTRVATARHSLGMSNYTAQCKDYIRKHYREKIYIDDIADSLGISTTYLSRLFKQDTGVTFQEFVNQVRVARAAELLAYTDMSLNDIAVYVHFPSQSYFGKVFKQYRNITPKGYRDRHKAGEFSNNQNV